MKPPTPVSTKKVPRTKHYRCWTWSHMPGNLKNYHAIGRTCPRMDTLAIESEVEELERTFGTHLDARDATLSQRLDFVATSMLASARRSMRVEGEVLHFEKHVLSANQWYARCQRELPFRPEMLDGLRQAYDENWRLHRRQYRLRLVEKVGVRPFDRTGDNMVLKSPIFAVTIKRKAEAS